MSIPDYQTVMLPLLKALAERGELQARDAAPMLADRFGLESNERLELLPSGKQPIFNNRVGWARTFLKKAGLLETPRRGLWKITPRGREVLRQGPERIDVKFLGQFPEFVEWTSHRDNDQSPAGQVTADASTSTPEEMLEEAHAKLQSAVASELLQMVKECSPRFFETLVVDLLVRMGYGGSHKDAGQAIGRSGDEGVDGVIKEDPLGLDLVYVQAKRWGGTVGRPEVQKFAGALQGQRARKGIVITTSDFSPDAKDFVNHIDSNIILISGQELVRLMIEHDLGVSITSTYHIKRIDSDYFSDD